SITRWSSGGIDYEEEAFATLLGGPLSPQDAERTEQTPSVLLLKLRARNRGANRETAHIWIGMQPAEPLNFRDNMLTAGQGLSIRAHLRLPAAAESRIESYKDGGVDTPALHVTKVLNGGEEAPILLALPFIPGLSAPEIARLRELDYASERSRVI